MSHLFKIGSLPAVMMG